MPEMDNDFKKIIDPYTKPDPNERFNKIMECIKPFTDEFLTPKGIKLNT